MKATFVLAAVFGLLCLSGSSNAVLDRHKCSSATWFRAARSGIVIDVKACILGGTDIEMKNAAGCTAAHAAATNGHQELMELLNEKGADLNFKCHNTGKTPLMLAAKKGDMDMVLFLVVEAKADPYIEVTDKEGTWTALSFAAWEGHIEVVLFFHKLEQHGMPAKREDFSGSWLMWAAGHGETDVTKLLSNGQEPGGTEVNARDEHGFTAAFWAGMLGHLDTLKVLVKEGADLTIASKSGLTMLMAAAFWGKADVSEYLLDSGLHPDQHDRAGWNACMWAAAKSQTEVMDQLFSTGKSCLGGNGGGWTALHIASATGETQAALWLIKLGASVDARTNTGKSAYDMALHRHNPGTHDALRAHHHGDDWMHELGDQTDPMEMLKEGYTPKKLHPDNHKPLNPSAVPMAEGSKFIPGAPSEHPLGQGHAKHGPPGKAGPQAGGPKPRHGSEL